MIAHDPGNDTHSYYAAQFRDSVLGFIVSLHESDQDIIVNVAMSQGGEKSAHLLVHTSGVSWQYVDTKTNVSVGTALARGVLNTGPDIQEDVGVRAVVRAGPAYKLQICSSASLLVVPHRISIL